MRHQEESLLILLSNVTAKLPPQYAAVHAEILLASCDGLKFNQAHHSSDACMWSWTTSCATSPYSSSTGKHHSTPALHAAAVMLC